MSCPDGTLLIAHQATQPTIVVAKRLAAMLAAKHTILIAVKGWSLDITPEPQLVVKRRCVSYAQVATQNA